jgi:uncharacterized coiled-coil DUF342 family protein
MKQIIMANTIITKFNKVWKSQVEPKLKKRNKLYSEISKLNSEINKLNSEINKLYSEINKLNSEINKLNSEILMIFYNFDKANSCQIIWDYSFKKEEINIKTYNQDKTGFILYKLDGTSEEELFNKVEEIIEQNGHKYKLIK